MGHLLNLVDLRPRGVDWSWLCIIADTIGLNKSPTMAVHDIRLSTYGVRTRYLSLGLPQPEDEEGIVRKKEEFFNTYRLLIFAQSADSDRVNS